MKRGGPPVGFRRPVQFSDDGGSVGIAERMTRILRNCLAAAIAGVIGIPAVLNAAKVSMTASDTNGAATSLISAGNWSNAQAPSSGNDYFTAGYLLRTPNTGTSNYFAGTSLSLGFNAVNPWLVGLSMKYPSSGSVRVDNLKFNGGAIINDQGGTMKAYGNITVLSNAWLNAGGQRPDLGDLRLRQRWPSPGNPALNQPGLLQMS
jgi:hypothetical protein